MAHENKIESAGYGKSKKCASATARDQALPEGNAVLKAQL